jgi:hypothetical protein
MNLQLRDICRCTRKNTGKGAEAYQASPYIPPSFSAMKGSCQLHHFLAHSTEQQILQICLRRGLVINTQGFKNHLCRILAPLTQPQCW